MLDFIVKHPLYIPFIIFNGFIIYKIIKIVLDKKNGEIDDDQDGGIPTNNFPELDLPPGVTLSDSPKEAVLNDW
ncbi:MAG: hypothetical protein H7Z76_07160 [Methylotenera sp.]|nr:hypothetical protein [Flavobacterium sp.]